MVVSLNSRLESNKEEEEGTPVITRTYEQATFAAARAKSQEETAADSEESKLVNPAP